MFILGAVIFGSIGVVAATIQAKDITYKNTNVESALNDLYQTAKEPLINKMSFAKKKDFSYGDWKTSRDVSINLEKGSYIIFLEAVDSYSSYSKSKEDVNDNITSSEALDYSNGTCEFIDGDHVSVGSSSGIDSTGVHVTAYSNTKAFKCVFTGDTNVSYTHTRPTAYSHIVEIYKIHSVKID